MNEAMNEAMLPNTDPRATTGPDQVTTAVINSGCFSRCLAIFFMISLASESVSHPSCAVLHCTACTNLFRQDGQTDRQTDGRTDTFAYSPLMACYAMPSFHVPSFSSVTL